MEPDRFDNLDELIDGGLAAYTPEPLAGLENRVLTRVRLDARRRRLGWWVLAIPAIATLIVIAVFSTRGPAPRPQPVPMARVDRSLAPAITTASHPPVRRRRAKQHKELPKQDQFPTPAPFTPEERALIAVAQLPPAELEAVVESQNTWKEIRIAPLEIPPVQIDGNQ
jgi:hypothetical protein